MERKRLIKPIKDAEVSYAGTLRFAVKISPIGLGELHQVLRAVYHLI
jgi:hypothetical protein